MFDPVPNFTKQNPLVSIITRITLEIELFTVLNCFAGAVKTYGSFISIRVSGNEKIMRYLSLCNTICMSDGTGNRAIRD